MGDYNLEKVTPAHYHLLQDLYQNAFNSTLPVSEIKKRFDTTQLGCEHIGFIAIHAATGIPAAYYGVVPVTLQWNDQEFLAAQSADTMTHTDHRMKGLFVSLAKLTYEECKKNGIEAVFGFPNKNSFPGFINKLNWHQIDSILRWDVKLRFKTMPFPKICQPNRLLSKLYSHYSRVILRKVKVSAPVLFSNNYPTEYAKVKRNDKYIEYKTSPDKFFIRIDDQILWIKLSDVLWVGDFENYATVTDSTIRKLRRIAFKLGFNTISFYLNESVPTPEFLNKFRKHSSEASCVYLIESKRVFRNILFTGADFDTW